MRARIPERLIFPSAGAVRIPMTDYDRDEFERVLTDAKEGGPREAGRFLASANVLEMNLGDFKTLASQGQMPEEVSSWLSEVELPKGAMKQIRNGFRSRVAELLDSLERSKSWEGFSGLSETDRWLEIRKG